MRSTSTSRSGAFSFANSLQQTETQSVTCRMRQGEGMRKSVGLPQTHGQIKEGKVSQQQELLLWVDTQSVTCRMRQGEGMMNLGCLHHVTSGVHPRGKA